MSMKNMIVSPSQLTHLDKMFLNLFEDEILLQFQHYYFERQNRE